MSAAENKFPDPPVPKPQWLPLAQSVFSEQATRWSSADSQSWCGGGQRWQIEWFNQGWNYKNSISNGGFFQLAARLGRYTGNQTYINWAEKVWDWSENIGLIDTAYMISDGAYVETNCTTIMRKQWSYNYGVYLLGAATMWNIVSVSILCLVNAVNLWNLILQD
jgi:mannan endo-1,6-alpha-mannosidase